MGRSTARRDGRDWMRRRQRVRGPWPSAHEPLKRRRRHARHDAAVAVLRTPPGRDSRTSAHTPAAVISYACTGGSCSEDNSAHSPRARGRVPREPRRSSRRRPRIPPLPPPLALPASRTGAMRRCRPQAATRRSAGALIAGAYAGGTCGRHARGALPLLAHGGVPRILRRRTQRSTRESQSPKQGFPSRRRRPFTVWAKVNNAWQTFPIHRVDAAGASVFLKRWRRR